MRINGRNRELEGYIEQEQANLEYEELIFGKNYDCNKCYWVGRDCHQSRLQNAKATKNGCMSECDYYYEFESDTLHGGDKYINSIIESGMSEYRKEWNEYSEYCKPERTRKDEYSDEYTEYINERN